MSRNAEHNPFQPGPEAFDSPRRPSRGRAPTRGANVPVGTASRRVPLLPQETIFLGEHPPLLRKFAFALTDRLSRCSSAFVRVSSVSPAGRVGAGGQLRASSTRPGACAAGPPAGFGSARASAEAVIDPDVASAATGCASSTDVAGGAVSGADAGIASAVTASALPAPRTPVVSSSPRTSLDQLPRRTAAAPRRSRRPARRRR